MCFIYVFLYPYGILSETKYLLLLVPKITVPSLVVWYVANHLQQQ